ncbi:MAG: insulinase family protein [Synechococcaceae bacterium WBB_10_009]|nr:insulinase family protein [Synechococcaceae bacterium WBB_10_009]
MPPQPVAAVQPLPDPQQLHLSNGAAVVQIDLPQAPVVCIDFWCRAGSARESSSESGIAHFLEHMVFKGSARLAAGEFDYRVEALGGNSNAATGFDDVHYHVLMPPEASDDALELLLDLVLEPRLDAADFELERQVVLEELAQSEDQPEEVAFQELLHQACGSHAYGLPILGEREALEAHRPDAMALFHRRHYRPERCCLAIAGPVGTRTDALRERLERSRLGQLQPGGEPETTPTPLDLQAGSARLELPRLEAARLLMVWQLPGAADQRTVLGGDLLTTLLAEGRRSRLVERLREELRLVESIDLDLNVLESGCLVLLEAVCEAEQLEAVEREVGRVLLELQERPAAAAEVERARRLVGNGYRFSLEVAGSVAAMVGNSHLWQRRHGLQAPLDWLQQWDADSLQRELVPLLAPERAFSLRAVPA